MYPFLKNLVFPENIFANGGQRHSLDHFETRLRIYRPKRYPVSGRSRCSPTDPTAPISQMLTSLIVATYSFAGDRCWGDVRLNAARISRIRVEPGEGEPTLGAVVLRGAQQTDRCQ